MLSDGNVNLTSDALSIILKFPHEMYRRNARTVCMQWRSVVDSLRERGEFAALMDNGMYLSAVLMMSAGVGRKDARRAADKACTMLHRGLIDCILSHYTYRMGGSQTHLWQYVNSYTLPYPAVARCALLFVRHGYVVCKRINVLVAAYCGSVELMTHLLTRDPCRYSLHQIQRSLRFAIYYNNIDMLRAIVTLSAKIPMVDRDIFLSISALDPETGKIFWNKLDTRTKMQHYRLFDFHRLFARFNGEVAVFNIMNSDKSVAHEYRDYYANDRPKIIATVDAIRKYISDRARGCFHSPPVSYSDMKVTTSLSDIAPGHIAWCFREAKFVARISMGEFHVKRIYYPF